MNKGILFFNAPWCQPCQILKPVIEQLGREGINIKSINTEYDAQNTEHYNVKSIPTLILTDLNSGYSANRFNSFDRLFLVDFK